MDIVTYVGGISSEKDVTENYSGMFDKVCRYHNVSTTKQLYIKEVIYSNPATIVIWNDGEKTVTKCVAPDVYSKETGLALCILKRLVGGAKMYNILKEWVTDSNRVTLRDVRHNAKNNSIK